MKRLLLLTTCMFSVMILFAQRVITGKVTDQNGNPVSNASVTIKETGNGVSTDANGNFSIRADQDAKTLVISFIGQASQEIAISNQSSYVISLSPESKKLDEVVVVAYGTQVKRKITGAITNVSGEELENKPFTSFDQMLQGKVPGLQSVSANGQPGAAQTVRIRGLSSVTGNNDPLYVVDGIPVTSGDVSRNSTTSNALAGINPNDIESISVLKDAAATAIYGSRAAAGVILITTKKGKAGKTKIKADVERGVGKVAYQGSLSKPLSRDEYYSLTREGLINAGASQAQTDNILDAIGINRPYNEDWLDLVTRDAGFTNLNFSASGGDQRTSFYTSVGYTEQEAPVIGSDFKRYSGNINLRHKASEKFSFGVNILASYTQQNSPTSSGAFRNPVLSAYFLLPTQNAYNDDGTVNFDRAVFNQAYNPLAIIQYDRGLFNNIKTISTINAEYNILKNLKLSTKFGIDYIGIEEEQYLNPFFGDARTRAGDINILTTRIANWVWTNLLEYHHDYLKSKDLGMDFKVGYESQRSKQFNTDATGSGLPFTTLLQLPAPSTPTSAFGARADFSQTALFSIVQFNYKNVSLSGSFRRDGSSRFGPENRYGNFWSTGAAWNIDRESFFQNIEIFDALKLRASYGLSGDNRGVTPYEWRGTYAFGSSYNQLPGSGPNTVGNPLLTWELSKQFDVGIDFSMFKNRLGGTIEWYKKKSEDLLFDVPLSRTTGFNPAKDNIGKMENKGWEIALNGVPVHTKNFTWDVNFNISLNRNKVTELPGGNDIRVGNQIRRVGENVSSFFTRLWAGVNPDDGSPLWYVDANKDQTTSVLPSFRDIIGQAMPKGFGSFGTTLSYKGLSLNAQFNYQYGHMVYDNWGFIMWSDGAFPTLNKIKKQLRRWQNPGDITDVPIYIYGNNNNSNAESSRWYYKGDFIRLRDLTLSYQLPASATSKAKMSNVSFYLRGTNLWTKAFDKDITFDPEQGFNGTNDLQVLIQKNIAFGVTIGF